MIDWQITTDEKRQKKRWHSQLFFLSFFDLIWFERLKEGNRKIERRKWNNDLRDDDERMEKERKTNQDNWKESKSKSLSFFHSFISNSNIWFQLWVDWLIVEIIWDSNESEKNEKNQKSHFFLKIQNKIK